MSKISDFIRNEYEEHQKILQETDEDAHTHTLWIRRMESACSRRFSKSISRTITQPVR